MPTGTQRIAINSGAGYVPGLNTVVAGAVLAADRLGWEAAFSALQLGTIRSACA